ncbi:hypothetical protein TRVA0_001S07250 [Trichomonascus vanleenenianus]|uniref:uncharacterized protein n=1 Tax=Trichomonascus vanleenenianus TaxID=2268995 RepID=UPI003EC9EE5B
MQYKLSSNSLNDKRSCSWSSASSDYRTLSQRSSQLELVDGDKEEDTVVLFASKDARLTQFNAIRTHDYDFPPNRDNRMKESLVTRGDLEVYKMLGKKAAFLRCGKFVHPILPRLRVWRTDDREFILPQPIPSKFWRIVLLDQEGGGEDLRGYDLEYVFNETCHYRNVVPPPSPPASDGEPDVAEEDSVEDEESPKESTINSEQDSVDPIEKDESTNSKQELVDLIEQEESISLEQESVEPIEHNESTDSIKQEESESIEEEDSNDPIEREEPIKDTKDNRERVTKRMERPHSAYSSSASTLDKILDCFEAPPAMVNVESGNATVGLIVNDSLIHDLDDIPSSSPASTAATSDSRATSASSLEGLRTTPPLVSAPYISHPLVPLATRNNIISSTFPLRFRPMDDDWLEISGSGPSYHYSHETRHNPVQWAGELVSSSSAYFTERVIPRRQSLRTYHSCDSMRSHKPEPSYSPLSNNSDVDFYHQALAVSGYVGWRIWNRLSPWAKRGY